MYRDADLFCPACREQLASVRSALPAMGCVGCGGLWLGPDATIHVMRGLGDALAGEVGRAARELARDARPPSVPEDSRVCPRCSQPLSRVMVGSVALDSCFTHGTFFDAREVLEVLRICGDLRDDQALERGTSSVGRLRLGWRRLVRLFGVGE